MPLVTTLEREAFIPQNLMIQDLQRDKKSGLVSTWYIGMPLPTPDSVMCFPVRTETYFALVFWIGQVIHILTVGTSEMSPNIVNMLVTELSQRASYSNQIIPLHCMSALRTWLAQLESPNPSMPSRYLERACQLPAS